MAFSRVRMLTLRLAAVALVALVWPTVALSQAAIAPPKSFNPVDANGVDLSNGTMTISAPVIAIGPQDGGLTYSRSLDTTSNIWRDNYVGTINTDPTHPVPENPTVTVTVMGQTLRFSQLSSGYEPVEDYATLTKAGVIWTLTLADGTVAEFSGLYASNGIYVANGGRITKLTRPNGEVLTFSYASSTFSTSTQYRLQSVTTTRGYQLHFDYADSSTGWSTDWDRLVTVTAFNNAYDGCAPTALTCTYSRTWPNLVFGVGTNEQNVTDALLRTTRYYFNGVGANGGLLIGIRKPSNSVNPYDVAIAWTYDTAAGWRVTGVTNRNSKTWTYAYGPGPTDPPPQTYTTTVTTTDPLGHTQVVGLRSMAFDTTDSHRVGRVGYVTNGVGKTTTYNYSYLYTLSEVIQPEGDKVTYVISPRGNITQATRTAKTGGATISQSAIYPGTCAAPDNPKTCNKPTSVTDGRGNATAFTYDATHGGVLTTTLPAPTSGAVQPQTRYAYAAYSAWYKDASGTIVQAATPIYMPTGTSTCATLASCTGGADEVKTTTAYQAGSSAVASNVLPLSTTSGNGTGTLAATTAMTYNARSDVITVDGPIPGAADTTRSYFDSMRQKNGEIRADPDGGGSLLFPATRTTFNADGQVTLVETGTATNQSDSGLGTFSMLQQTQTDYDIIGRKAKTSLYGSGATQTVSQYDYDDANRPSCSTVRMNPAAFGSLPSSACTLGTAGSDGDDRITSTAYDNANRVTQVSSGLNTAAVRVEQTTTYTDNGKEQTVADGKGNLTTYEYDGFDRLQKVRYPNSTGSGSSTTDFDLYGYDANDNRTSWQRRGSGSAVTFSFDALNRQTSGLRGEIYAYDNLNRRTSATVSSAAVTMSYDALGRMLTETAHSYSMAYQYDLAGNRTRITWPDSVYVTYEYDNLYRMTAAKESGSSTLVGVSYDNLGRRTGLSRLNGVTTGYGYDGASRLSSIAHELAGSTYDQTLTMAYTAASQIRTRASSNSLYDWTGTQLTGTYTANGLNQIAAAGSRVPTYDVRGNMTYDGVTSFTYDIANNLVTTTGGGGTTVDYDALGRLRAITQGGGTTSLAYSGPDIVSEFDNSGALFRRYVPGPNPDEHWVWYNGAGTTDRRYYLQDQVGSVIGLADNSGGAYAINAYDEYGVPKSGNQGRYQYTGQAWLSSLGFYSFKARMYHPTLGRFLQTDPTGYDDGLNWYAYVGNDPLNQSDPAGTQAVFLGPGNDRNVTAEGGGFGDDGARGSGYSTKSLNRDLATQKRDFAQSQAENMPEVNRQLLIGGGATIAVGVTGGTVSGLVSASGIFSTVPAGLEVLTGRTAGAQLMRLAVPEVPSGFTTSTFGRSLVQWGNGAPGAVARTEAMTSRSVAAMREQGLSRFMARQWRDFYASQVGRRGGEVAASRAELLKRILGLW